MTLDASLVVLLPRFLIRLDVSVQPLAGYFGAFCGIFLPRGKPRPLQRTRCINSKITYTPLELGPKQMSVIGIEHLVLASNNRIGKLGNQVHAGGQKVQADVYRQRSIDNHEEVKISCPL